jgi:ABC-type cobalamin/Fe3+-siderophores transport system ATPase subunit
MNALLEVQNLNRKNKPVLPEISFTLNSGESLALVGPNGTGKTTLIKSLLGLLSFEGQVSLAGRSLLEFSKKELAQNFAYVPQVLEYHCSFKVEQYLALSFYSQGLIDNDRKADAVKIFRLQTLLAQNFNLLSGGERQRVLLASAYCQNPKIYFLDEPFSALDICSVKELTDTLALFKKSGSAIILSIHDLGLVSKCADRVLQVEQGQVLEVDNYLSLCAQVLGS